MSNLNQNLLNIHRLKSLRAIKAWDQQTLATKAGIDRSIISRLERGLQQDLRVSVLVGLARALSVSVDSLLLDPPSQYQGATSEGQSQQQLASQEITLSGPLNVLLPDLAELSGEQQMQVAAIIRAYIHNQPQKQPN